MPISTVGQQLLPSRSLKSQHPGPQRRRELTAGMIAGAIAAGLVSLLFFDDGIRPIGIFLSGIGLGWLLVRSDFGYASGFRHFVERGDGATLVAGLTVAAVAALVVIPMSMLWPGYYGAIVPVGIPLIVGAALFGVGMQFANGCGSGTLYAAGSLSRRSLLVLPFFCIGAVLGGVITPAALRLPDLGVVDFGDLLGPWGGLAVTEAMIAVLAIILVRRGSWPTPAQLGAGAMIGALAAVAFLLSGQTWGITSGLTLWGAKAVGLLGIDLTGTEYWSWEGNRRALAGSVLESVSSLMDIGLLLGATMAAAFHRSFKTGIPLGVRGAVGAVIGGLLMGVGARLSSGCNIGAFIGGVSSGSIHGFIWFIAALPGCWLGMRLRPWFGFPV